MAGPIAYQPYGWTNDQWGQYQQAIADKASADAASAAKPVQPGYKGIDDANGNVLDQYSLEKAGVGPNESSMNMIRDRAMGTSMSPWAALAKEGLNTDTQNALDTTDKQGASANAGAMDQLAQFGGLSEGARERVATTGARANALNKNSVLRQQVSGNQQIGMQDEAERAKLLGAMPGMENSLSAAKSAIKEYDIGNATGDVAKQNAFNQNTYSEQMKAWAANKQADATEKSGKK